MKHLILWENRIKKLINNYKRVFQVFRSCFAGWSDIYHWLDCFLLSYWRSLLPESNLLNDYFFRLIFKRKIDEFLMWSNLNFVEKSLLINIQTSCSLMWGLWDTHIMMKNKQLTSSGWTIMILKVIF